MEYTSILIPVQKYITNDRFCFFSRKNRPKLVNIIIRSYHRPLLATYYHILKVFVQIKFYGRRFNFVLRSRAAFFFYNSQAPRLRTKKKISLRSRAAILVAFFSILVLVLVLVLKSGYILPVFLLCSPPSLFGRQLHWARHIFFTMTAA